MNARSVSNNGVLHALTRIRLKAGAFTMATVLSLTFLGSSTSVYAQQTSGALYGKVAAGSTVTAENAETGAKRSVTASSDGSYRIGALPPGNYKVSFSDGTSKEASVALGSSTLVGAGSEVLELEKFVVGGLSVNPIDFGNTETVSVFNSKTLDILPVARDPMAVALLAPGTTMGDTAFGEFNTNLVSSGGASVSENAYFINGFNISNFRNGLDPAKIPYEFYNQFEIKVGGYGAEFGRSTGGVINATTKSGSNEYHAGANFYFQPDAGRQNAPSSYFTNTSGVVVPLVYNDADYWQEWEANAWASGALWKNKVFFYGIYNARNVEREDAIINGTRMLKRKLDDPFYAVKIDITPIDGQRLEYTGFQDKSSRVETEYDFDYKTGIVSGDPAFNYYDRGGRTHIGKYTGVFFEKLQISAMYGKSFQDRTDSGSEDSKPFIYDGRSGSLVYIQGNPNLLISTASDERKASRFDAEYPFELFGKHRVRAGFDREDNTSTSQDLYSGGKYWRYYAIPSSGLINGVPVTGTNVGAVRERVYQNGGSFKVKSDAWYVEDNWTLFNDRLNLRLGLRNESFENLNGEGKTFIKITGQKAPRLALSYDLRGDKKTKVFANFGRYHLPVASNTNVRLAGGELFTEKYFVLTSLNADKTPVIGAQLGNTNVFSDGTVKDRRAIVDLDVKPMYQDEYIVGIQHALSKDYSVGARFTHRIISGTAMDDMIVDHALTAWANGHGFGGFDATGEHAYVLANPGRPIHMFWDFDGDGTLSANEEATLSPELLGYPKATRVYYALELFAEKVWDGKWNASFSYTWSQSFGNYEGWVLSDTGQDDAGITTLFDSPMNTVNTYGYLPNDRRHQIKVFGSYSITPEWQIGSNILLSSGRPINKIGWQNDPVRGATSNDYLLVPRGSVGTTDWVFNTNLSLVYRPKWGEKHMTFALDVFNILNGKAVTEVAEVAQNASGGVDPSYGTPSSWQRPRYFRLSANFEY